MSTKSDWDRWQEEWRKQPVLDADRLLRSARHKRRRMQIVVAFECVVAVFATSQLIHLFLLPGVELRWRVWSLLAAALLAFTIYLEFRWRRGTWKAATESVADVLRLTARRAHAGIRLAWTGIIGTAVLMVMTLAVATPWLAPSRWRHDPALQRLLLVQIGVNGVLVFVTVSFCIWYIIHLRRKLGRVQAMLQDYIE